MIYTSNLMSKQTKKEKKAAQRAAAANERDNTRVAPATPITTRTTRASTAELKDKRPLTFGKDTYTWMGIGFALVVVGLLLMSGGRGEDPNVFDESVIYSFRRITLAPIVMLAGLGTVIYAILKK